MRTISPANVWSVVLTSTVMPLDKRLVGEMFTLTIGQLNGWEEGKLLNRSLDEEL